MIVAVIGASILMFLVKSGSVAILVDAERHAPGIEQPPLRQEVVREGNRFSLEAFSAEGTNFGRRFVRLGLILTAAYAVTIAIYPQPHRPGCTAGPTRWVSRGWYDHRGSR